MPFAKRTQHPRSRFNQPRPPSARAALTRIQRRARDLMSVASVLAFCTVMAWLLIGFGLWQASNAGPGGPSSAQNLLERWHLLPKQPFDTSALSFAWLLAFAASMAPIVCLRSLGKALYTQAPLSSIVAQRFLWLGRALVGNIVIAFAAGWIAATQIKAYQLTFSLGFWGTVIAAILAYVVAEMVREGALALEENREFI